MAPKVLFDMTKLHNTGRSDDAKPFALDDSQTLAREKIYFSTGERHESGLPWLNINHIFNSSETPTDSPELEAPEGCSYNPIKPFYRTS